MNYDLQLQRDYSTSPSSLYFWILASSYIYYCDNATPLLSDGCFDWACKTLLERFDEIPEHSKLKGLITEDGLRAGSFYNILSNHYPLWMVRMAQEMSKGLDKGVA